MSKGLDKNVLIVAVVGVVVVVGLFALLGSNDDASTGRYVDDYTAIATGGFKKCLTQFSDALNTEELCECKFPRRSQNPESTFYDRRLTNEGCDVDAVYPEADTPVKNTRIREGTYGKTLEFEKQLMQKALDGDYANPEMWVDCKLAGGKESDCDGFKFGETIATGNFVNIFKICLAKEEAKGTMNADLYCMCREAYGEDCRGNLDRPGVERAEYDECAKAFTEKRFDSLTTGLPGYGRTSTKEIWGTCSRMLA